MQTILICIDTAVDALSFQDLQERTYQSSCSTILIRTVCMRKRLRGHAVSLEHIDSYMYSISRASPVVLPLSTYTPFLRLSSDVTAQLSRGLPFFDTVFHASC